MRMLTSFRDRSRRVVKIFILFVMVAILTPPAYSRDDPDRTFPDEITYGELELYGGWLNLSESQLMAIGQYHRKYLVRFAKFKEDVIDQHKRKYSPLKTFNHWYKGEEKYWRETEDIRRKIQRVDESLFMEITDILADSQLSSLQRVRDHRERQTLRISLMISLTQRKIHDLTKFAYDLKLSDSDASLLDPLLQSYERRLTSLSKVLHTEAMKMETAPIKEHIRRGYGDSPLHGDQKAWQQTSWETWGKQGGPIEKLIHSIDDLNESLTRRVEQTLSHEGIQLWLYEYVTRSFQRAGKPREKRRLLMKVMKQIERLSEPDQVAMKLHMKEFDRSLRSLERRYIDIEKNYLPWVHYTLIGHGVERPNKDFQDDINNIQIEFDTLFNSFLGQLKEKLTLNGFEQWDLAYAEVTKRKSKSITHPNGNGIYRIMYAPVFIEDRDLKRITRMMNLSDKQQAIIQEAHKVYSKNQVSIEQDLPENLRELFDWYAPYPPAICDRMQQADERVFQTLERMLEVQTDRLRVNWLRNSRNRMRLAHGGSISGAGAIDITLFILDNELPTEDLEQIADLIDEYDTLSITRYRQLYSTYTTHYEWCLDNLDDKSRIYPHYDPVVKMQQAITKMNVDTMHAIGDRLESDAGTAMMDLFTRYCYRPVFDDPNKIHSTLTRAKRVDDLNTTQRDELLVLGVSYLEDYQRLTDAMMEAAKYTTRWGRGIDETRPSPSGFEEAKSYKRNQFLRDELNAATLVKLGMILTEEQIEAIGGLPKMKKL